MANYPPTPSFGGPFFAPHWPPPPGPHPPYQGERIPVPPPPLHAPPNHSFMPPKPPASTPQLPGLGGHSTVPIPPPPYFPPQYHNPNFPPSPYYSGLPQEQQVPAPPPQQQEPLPTRYNGGSSVQTPGERSYVPVESQSFPQINDGGRHTIESGAREEGELSDGELDAEQPSMDSGLAENDKDRNGENAFSDTRHQPVENPSVDDEGSTHRRTHTPRFSHRKRSPKVNSDSQTSCASVGMEHENGNITPLDPGDIARKSGDSSTMRNMAPQNPEVVPIFPGSQLPGLRAPPTIRNDIVGAIRDTKSPARPAGEKTPAQLRVMAQGALLGLAPHSVRFHELVNEGIDPVILRRLYEDIGIKVSPDSGNGKEAAEAISPSESTRSSEEETYTPPEPHIEVLQNRPGLSTNSISHPEFVSTTIAPAQEASKSPDKPQAEAHPRSAQPVATEPSTSGPDKPLERKEVIARMLAARAKKPVPNQADSGKEQTLSQLDSQPKPVEKENGITSSRVSNSTQAAEGQSIQPSETPVKEKNKAQTELARQRMEKLKKQGLSLSNRRVNSNSSSPSPPPQPQKPDDSASEPMVTEISQTPQGSLNYPLPNRPPVSESLPQSRIPGLFMTSSDPPATENKEPAPVPHNKPPQAPFMPEPTTRNQALSRKRPVASDFTDEPAAVSKKPYNQGKQSVTEDKVIIDISEDELMYDAGHDKVHFDEKRQSSRSRTQVNSNQSLDRGSTKIQSKTPTKPPSRQSGHISGTPTKGKDQEDLRQKQLEIQAMRKRIAEFEKRHKAKQTASRTQSPSTQSHTVSLLPETSPASQGKGLHATNKPTGPLPTELPSAKLEPTQAEAKSDLEPSAGQTRFDHSTSSPARTRPSLDPTNLNEMRQKFLRKKEIESGLPLLEAELLKYEQKLAEFRKEEEKLLAEITKGKEGKRQLIAELESLGIETEGLSMEELQATKDILAENGSIDNTPATTALTQSPTVETSNNEEETALETRDPDDSTRSKSASEVAPSVPQETLDSNIHSSIETERPNASVEELDDHEISSSSMDESTSSARSVSSEVAIETKPSEAKTSPNLIMPDAPSLNADSAAIHTSSDSHAPPSDYNTPSMPTVSERYEGTHSAEGQCPDVHREGSPDSDAYEPPEPDTARENIETVPSSPFSPASPHSVEVANASMPPLSVSQEGEPLTERIQDPPEEANAPREPAEDKEKKLASGRHFTPYISPLKQFNAYRYHPSYIEDVNDGYRSLTYSHDIDPDKFLCVFEASGGICKDGSCVYQHFRDMYLSDDKILVQMGSLREGKTPQEKEEYIAGLKKIISDMRRDKVKDFNTVATEIAAYRRRFLEDPSRILPL